MKIKQDQVSEAACTNRHNLKAYKHKSGQSYKVKLWTVLQGETDKYMYSLLAVFDTYLSGIVTPGRKQNQGRPRCCDQHSYKTCHDVHTCSAAPVTEREHIWKLEKLEASEAKY